MSEKVVVTGGCGFIGKHLCVELLHRGYDVYALDLCVDLELVRLGVKVFRGDVRHLNEFGQLFNGCSTIYHLSGLLGTSELFQDPLKAVDVNIVGALNVLEIARKNNVKLFLPTKPNEWDNIYSMTSSAVQKSGMAYKKFFGLDVRILKIWNVFGPRQKMNSVKKVFPVWIKSLRFGDAIEIFGDGMQLIKSVFVFDLVKYMADYMEYSAEPNVVYEIKLTHDTTVLELAHKLMNIYGSKENMINYKPLRIGEENNCEYNVCEYVEDWLCVGYKTDFNEAIQVTVDWYNEFFDNGK